MREAYCTPSGEKKVVLKADLTEGDHDHDFMSDMGDALAEIAEPPSGLERASQHLLQELYVTEFEVSPKSLVRELEYKADSRFRCRLSSNIDY